MNAAIKCECRTVIVYDAATMLLRCPHCNISWYQQPDLFCDGMVAMKVPNVLDGLRGEAVDDEWCKAVVHAAGSQEAAPRVAFMCDDKPVIVEVAK